MLSRKSFLKNIGIAGACTCSLASIARSNNSKENNAKDDVDKSLTYDWIAALLKSVDEEGDDVKCRTIMKRCAISHYQHLNMDDFLRPFEGNIVDFNSFIEREWGWKIEYHKSENVLIADENKTYCVCPMADAGENGKLPILCYCSEGFAELMFSKVIGHPVIATVISSVRRGGRTCKYKIEMQ